MNVFDLAQEDTSLQRVSFKEYAGSCPHCGGVDRFHVQPHHKDGGVWMCRNCWPAEEKGWADGISYLRHMRGMSFTAAKNFLVGEDEHDVLFDLPERISAEERGNPPGEEWQARTRSFVELSVRRLWSKFGSRGLDYLHDRGLTDVTIKAAQLGYSEEKGEDGELIPRLSIPWHAENGCYWCVNRRDLRPDVPHDQRYKVTFRSSKFGLYGGELLTRKYPTFLVESEIDALSIAQKTRDVSINVVATGGESGCMNVPQWIGRLARMPAVFLAQDSDTKGEKQAADWLKILDQNAIRYRPLAKDANAMLLQGSIKAWVQGALELLNVESEIQDGEASLPIDAEKMRSARAFYESWCAQPGYYVRLRADNAIGLGVPETMSDEQFMQIARLVNMYQAELRMIMRKIA